MSTGWVDERRKWALDLLAEASRKELDIIIQQRQADCLKELDKTLEQRQKQATELQRCQQLAFMESLKHKRSLLSCLRRHISFRGGDRVDRVL